MWAIHHLISVRKTPPKLQTIFMDLQLSCSLAPISEEALLHRSCLNPLTRSSAHIRRTPPPALRHRRSLSSLGFGSNISWRWSAEKKSASLIANSSCWVFKSLAVRTSPNWGSQLTFIYSEQKRTQLSREDYASIFIQVSFQASLNGWAF